MLAANIPARFVIPFAKNAGGSFIRSIPTSSQIGITDGAASFNDGFVPLNFTPKSGGGVPPFGKDMNGILFASTSWDQWFQLGGQVPWDATFSSNVGGYMAGSVVMGSTLGSFYFSTVDNNTSNPNTGGANWVGFTPISLYAIDTGAANAMVAALVPAPASLAALTGMPIRIKKIASPNSGAVTLALNGFTATPILHADGTALVASELPANGIISIVFDGTNFQLQSTPASSVTPAQLQIQPGNFAVDTGAANVLVITLSPVPASLASINGSPIRIKKSAAANTTAVTINANSLGGQPLKHADGTDMASGELPANGLFEVGWDNAAGVFTLLSPPLAPAVPAAIADMEAGSSTTLTVTPARFLYSEGAIKGHIFFHWNGSTIVTSHKSATVASVSRVGVGHYQIAMTGGLNFLFGYAMVNGGGTTPAAAGGLGTGRSFSGTNPTIDVYFGDAGGSGGEASDPPDAGVLIFGQTQN